MGMKDRAKQLKTDIPAIFIALKQADTPVLAKILAGITIGYALSPIDLIPDFIPVLGYLDDIIILPALIAWTISLIPDDVMMRCREKSKEIWADGRPKKWYYALPIVLIWVCILFLIIYIVI